MSVQISAELGLRKFRAEAKPCVYPYSADLKNILIANLLIAVSAHVAIPLWFTPVPFTLQTFAVILAGLTLGSRRGFLALLLYLAEGAAGLPVFSPYGPGGFAQLLGPTGGYLMLYPLAAFLAGYATEQWHPKEKRSSLAADILFGALSADMLIFAGGSLWFAKLTHLPAPAVFTMTVVPFIPGELVKLAVASMLAVRWKKIS